MSTKPWMFPPPYISFALLDFNEVKQEYQVAQGRSKTDISFHYHPDFNSEEFLYLSDINLYIPPQNNTIIRDLLDEKRSNVEDTVADFENFVITGRDIAGIPIGKVKDESTAYTGVFTADKDYPTLVGWCEDYNFNNVKRGKEVTIYFVFNTNTDYYTQEDSDRFLLKDFREDYLPYISACYTAVQRYYQEYDTKFGKPIPTNILHNTNFKTFYDKI